ncbi:hypothetical protein GCM10010918_25270 [Paenibacillus radicis (ex Gao et al. 2016)]|uniref:HTH lysR-type domain-containing protein n=1 Tax=Paenibacillus radicis (ex Gao et al. 2016) TaxID=1737354 RepID=A0A917H6H0_9BACL|nr:hypothetical protein GCM10010918_25270 [Paenibacillus radicis (ex Gao et al. 2016)]
MDIQLLKVFYTTAQEGSISKAAQKLTFAQSNVTHKIQQLEADLQTQLFYRHNRGITLTPTGHILLSKFCMLFKKQDQPSVIPPYRQDRF